MAEVQDEEQWLYGDDKDDSQSADKESGKSAPAKDEQKKDAETESDKSSADGALKEALPNEKQGEPEGTGAADQNGEKEKGNEREGRDDAADDSSSDDEPTVTIGKIVKQPDIIRPPLPTHRAAPTSGLKDEDFSSIGKINGVPATDFNLAELEDKPWRKPGADLSDYFNYGFTEDSWIKYCERQKVMRTSESGIGLTGLGLGTIGKTLTGSSNIPVSILNENSKYGGLRKIGGFQQSNKPKMSEEENKLPSGQNYNNLGNTIQVMTADRRTYSNKVLGNVGGYEDLDFGGGSPYIPENFFNTPPPNSPFYNPPPPPPPPPHTIPTPPWPVPNVPPPGWTPERIPPPPMPVLPPSMGFFEEDSRNTPRLPKEDRAEPVERHRESREPRESRHSHSRRQSRSQSRSRHRKRSRSTSGSRTKSPSSHRHKRKKSKRDREAD